MADDETQAADEAGAKKGGLIPLAAVAIGALAAGGAGAFFLAPDPAASGDEATHAEAKDHAKDGKSKSHDKKKEKTKKTAKKDSHGKKKDKSKGKGKGDEGEVGPGGVKIVEVDDTAYVEMPPLVVSIAPIGRARHVRIRIVLQTPVDEAEALSGHAYHINDVLNTFLRAVSASNFEDPTAMTGLKEQIERRINVVAPDVHIENVLITEFLLS